MTAYSCPRCGFELWVPVTSLSVSDVGFYDDNRFPGRCLVVLRKHYDHLDEVPLSLSNDFLHEVKRVGAALRAVVGVARINYAVLGNVEPHVHAHVIPRGGDADLVPGRSPWEHPKPAAPLSPARRDEIVGSLRRRLTTEGPPAE